MKKTNKLIQTWSGVEFQSSTVKTEQFKKFAREFKAAIKEQTQEDFEIVGYSVGHFYISGFLKSKIDPNQFVYFSTSDVRGFADEWRTQVLVRTAKHEKDYTGGHNNYTSLESFGDKVRRLANIAA